jgi:hypothetical protein
MCKCRLTTNKLIMYTNGFAAALQCRMTPTPHCVMPRLTACTHITKMQWPKCSGDSVLGVAAHCTLSTPCDTAHSSAREQQLTPCGLINSAPTETCITMATAVHCCAHLFPVTCWRCVDLGWLIPSKMVTGPTCNRGITKFLSTYSRLSANMSA